VSCLPTLVGIFLKAQPEYAIQRRRSHFLHGWGRPFQDRGNHACVTRTIECAFSGEHLVQHAAEREKVSPIVGQLALQLLRRHVLQRTDDGALLRQRSGQRFIVRVGFLSLFEFRDPEVKNLNACLRHQNVRGFQVSMGDALAVRRLKRTGQLYRQP
jgi:hypothetical protein